MKMLFCLGLVTLSLALASVASPAAAVSTAPIAPASPVRSLDNLGPVTTQDTIEYDDTANI